jgi:sugar phosphate isomerase/epimerase
MFKNLDFEALGVSGHQSELIELTLSYGFKGFDLDLGAFAQQVEKHGLDRARRLIDSAKLKLGSFPLPVDCDAPEETFHRELEKLPKQIKLAADVGCTRARATIAPANDSLPYHECFELYRRRFRQIGEVLADGDLRLGVGFIAPAHHRRGRAYQFISTFDALLLLVKSVGAANVGICFDSWHWHVSGGLTETLEALMAQDIVTVTLADAQTAAGDDNVDESTCVLPCEGPEAGGLIDMRRILTRFAQIGYDGPVTPRAHPGCFEGLRRDEIIKQAGEALDKVWAAAKLSKRGKLVGSS